MFRTDHLSGPLIVGRYHAPYGYSTNGRPILPDREEIEFFIDGEGYFSWEGREMVVHGGMMLWHLPGEVTLHRNNHQFPYECLTLTFPVSGPPMRQVPKVTQWDDPVEARAFAMEVLRLYHRDETDKCKLGQYVYLRLLWNAYDAARFPRLPELPHGVRMAMHILESEFAQPLHLAQVAERVGISTVHLHALFKAQLGMSPYQYLLKWRLQEARRLLASTDLLVKEISYACGFQDVANFCRCFKARFNVSPGSYRARHLTKMPEQSAE